MAQTGYSKVQIYSSSTATNTPSAGNLTNDTNGSELAINITDGKLFYKDNSSAIQVIGWKTTPTTAGGTGLTSYTAGDLPYYASGSTLSKLGIGTSGYVLQSNGSAPTWVAQSTLSVGTATNATNTAITDNTSSSATWYPTIVSATTGNLPQTTSSTKLSFVPSTGTLTATSHAGAWAGSTIGTTYGGTGLTSFTANGVVYASSTSALATGTALNFDGTSLNVGTTTSTGIFNVVGNGPSNYNAIFSNSVTNNNVLLISGTSTSTSQNYVVFAKGGTATGTINYNGTTVTYNSLSDRRLKTNIELITTAQSGPIIDSLMPRSFNWLSDNSADVGFIADELQPLVPKSVQGQPNAVDESGNPVYQMIDPSTPEIMAYLVAEVQSLRARLKNANIA